MQLDIQSLTYESALPTNAGAIFSFCRDLIDRYETDPIDREHVLAWVKNKIETHIDEYTAIRLNGQTVGYYRFFRAEDGTYELDDLYVLPAYRGYGIGTAVIHRLCASVDAPVTLFVFIKNERAVALYRRLGFTVTDTVGGSRYVMTRTTDAK